MRVAKFGKVVFYKDLKQFFAKDGLADSLDEALVYEGDMDNETILSFFDEGYRKKLEIWEVRYSIETL